MAKTALFSLLVSVISIKVIKTKTSFLEILCKYLNNSFFYYNCNTSLYFTYMLAFSNNFNLY